MGDRTARALRVAGAGGSLLAVWITGGGTVVTSALEEERWRAVRALSPPGRPCTGPVLAVGGGRVVAGWVDDETRPVVRDGTCAGDWGASTVLAAAWSGAAGLRVAVDPEGSALAAWTDTDGVVSVAESAASARWTAARPLSEPGEPAYAPAVAASAAGAAVAWMHAGALVRLAVRTAGGAWGAPATVTPPGGGGFMPAVALGEGGTVAVTWPGEDGRVRVFAGTLGAPGGTVHDLGDGRDPRVAWRDGTLTVDWDAG